jgi:hypothetical protein
MDFVIPWVDGADPDWRVEFSKYSESRVDGAHAARFRDWGTLRYWFRGVAAFAPWVDRIHFITWGHLPSWLEVSHPKINVVRHADYIPPRYLPTFSAQTIELNFHRIASLADQYVYFNDDMFLIRPMRPDSFFKSGLPCDQAAMKVLVGGRFQHILLENIGLLNSHLANKFRAVAGAPGKWFHPCYGKHALYNLLLTGVSRYYTGFANFHLPQAARKQTLAHLWDVAHDELDAACRYRFRNFLTVNQYAQRYWEFATDNFHPVNMKRRGRCFELRRYGAAEAAHFIRTQRAPLVCVNDHENVTNFARDKSTIQDAFGAIFPEPCEFERDR